MKTCPHCKTEKPLSEFHRRNIVGETPGHASWCKACTAEKQRLYYKKNIDKARAVRKAYYRSHKDQFRKYYLKEKVSGSRRETHLRKRYEIGSEDYEKLYRSQNGCCAICKQSHVDGTPRLTVDHDHKTNVVRGLLCFRCNVGVGNFRDNPDLMRSAIEYLETHSAVTK